MLGVACVVSDVFVTACVFLRILLRFLWFFPMSYLDSGVVSMGGSNELVECFCGDGGISCPMLSVCEAPCRRSHTRLTSIVMSVRPLCDV